MMHEIFSVTLMALGVFFIFLGFAEPPFSGNLDACCIASGAALLAASVKLALSVK